jgi:hypothetical protein
MWFVISAERPVEFGRGEERAPEFVGLGGAQQRALDGGQVRWGQTSVGPRGRPLCRRTSSPICRRSLLINL